MLILRPHLMPEKFVARVRAQQEQGYRLMLLPIEGRVAALAGFRIQDMLFSGRTLYVDDFVTHPDFRRRGYGEALFQVVIGAAQREGCQALTLDSGPQRQDAHRFYLNQGMRISSLHFAMAW